MKNFSLLLFLFFSSILYGSFLSRSPVHLNQDELGFALNAYSISQTGFDANGRFLPLYFWHLGIMWATPVTVYLTALVLKILSFNEANIRVSTVLIGVLDIALLWFVAKDYFRSKKMAYLAALLLAVTPAHFINSRLLLDNLYSVPFALGWLLLMQRFLQKEKIKYLIFASFLLGIGIHSYHAAKITMPVFFLMTLFVAIPYIKKNLFLLPILILSFSLAILPVIPWVKVYPDTFTDQVRYTNMYDVKLSAKDGVLSLLQLDSLVKRSGVFVSFFDPNFLFLIGDMSLIHSTKKTGVFLFPLILLIPLGCYWLLKKPTKFNQLILMGFFTSPLAGALAADEYRISRVLIILPFAILMAGVGFQVLWQAKQKFIRAFSLLIILFCLAQFGFFYYDYLKDYRIRSASIFNYNIPGALEEAIKLQEKNNFQQIYFDGGNKFFEQYWRFFLIKHHQLDLLNKTAYINAVTTNFDNLSNQSLMVLNFNQVDGLKENLGPFKKIRTISEPNGTASFYIYSN